MSLKTIKDVCFQLLLEKFERREAQAILRQILMYHLGFDWSEIIVKEEHELSKEQISKIEDWTTKVIHGFPIDYLIGYKEFYDLKFSVDKNVLIPRSETEELVELILTENKYEQQFKVWDIGCGSGCISLALKNQMPEWKIIGSDVSNEAVNVARKNAENLDLEVNYFLHDILEEEMSINVLDHLDVIVSNPPYIPFQEQQKMDASVLMHEPSLALYTPSNDPLIFYRNILQKAFVNRKTTLKVYFEINEFKAKEIFDLVTNLGLYIEIFQDLNKKDRMVKVCSV